MKFGKLLKIRMSEKGITNQAEFANKIGIAKSTLNSMINRETNNVDIDVFFKICKALDCNPDEFYYSSQQSFKMPPSFVEKYGYLDDYGKNTVNAVLNEEYIRCTAPEEPECETIELPFSTLKASAGLGDYLFEEYFDKIEVKRTEESEQASFAIEVDGDSMEPNFSNGDIVLVKGTPNVDIGDIGIFIIDNQGYIKERGESELISLNDDYPNIRPSEFSECRAIGRVVGKAEF
jgi:DNA-binding Xre family transcriptional regulator